MGERKTGCGRGEGTLFAGRGKIEKEKKVERVWHWVHTGRKPLQTTDWGVRRTECCSIFLQRVCSLRFWKYETFTRGLVHTPGEKEGSGPRVHKNLCRDLLGCTGRDRSPSWDTTGKGYIASSSTKDPVGANMWPFISRAQSAQERVDNQDTAFPGATP